MFSGSLSATFVRFSLVHRFVRADLVTTISHKGLNNFDKTDREYLLAPVDNLVKFWR